MLNKLRYILFSAFVFCFATAKGQGVLTTYCIEYPKNCERTHQFIEKHYSTFDSIVKQYHYPATFLLSIVAPEISRYNEASDQAQTAAVEMFYSQLGSDYADFSIGCYQMKASFIEAMENYASNDSLLKQQFKTILHYETERGMKTRDARVQRLKQMAWQTQYLCLFYGIMEQKYGTVKFESEKDKLWFYATAYNTGFDKKQEEIEKWEKIAWFPNGDTGPGNFIYSFVANEFFYRFNN